MPPAKRKAPFRRQVLDLKGEDSSFKPTWQTKYQSIQYGDEVDQNGESIVESSDNRRYPADAAKTNPLSGLISSYNSDSDNEDSLEAQKDSLDAKVEVFLKEIQSLSSESVGTTTAPNSTLESQLKKPDTSSLSKWQQCYDHNSGYPYYWNTETNEVTWEIPSCFEVSAAAAAETATDIAAKLYQTVQNKEQQLQEASLRKEKKEAKRKVICKYPWENESDSEEEKIEMITSFGPESGEEDSSEEEEQTPKSKTQKCKGTAKTVMVGPQLPPESVLAQYKKRMSESDDTEAESLHDSSYETSSLLTYRVQDTGPPGDDGFSTHNEIRNTENETKSNIEVSPDIANELSDNSLKKDFESSDALKSNVPFHSNAESHLALESSEKIIKEPCSKDQLDKSVLSTVVMSGKYQENVSQNTSFDFADNVIAEIEKETPPDYSTLNPKIEENSKEVPASDTSSDNSAKIANNAKVPSISSIALLANYEGDSDPEEGNVSEKRKGRDKKATARAIKPLFPCMDPDAELSVKESLVPEKKTIDCETGKIYELEVNLSDPCLLRKAFKRKKRIEFATTGFGSSAPSEPKAMVTNTQYNMDPTSNDHRGFGFAPVPSSIDSNKSKSNADGWIQFVKMETINLNQDGEPKQKTESRMDGKQKGSEEDTIALEEIEDAASLLKEKVTFLTVGKEEISPIQHIAIQLETLLVAWQQGALSNVYFCRWVKDKCSALIRHEKSAAPTGWICLWDRKSKRYFYRNVVTKAIQWDYPTSENEAPVSSINSKQTKEGDLEGGGEEMELCLTPPHPLTTEEDKTSHDLTQVSAAAAVTDIPRAEGVTLASPVTSDSSFMHSERLRNAKSKNRKDLPTVSEDEGDSKSTSTSSLPAYTECEKQTDAPPLPPMPPPPPPEEPPPPPPGSPPPIPLAPDQPLPPGVDEPEYGLFRRQSPRHSLVKSQVDSSSYSTDVIMSYGYAVQVQTNAPSVAALSLQPVEYHSYVHDHLNTNHYVVQSAPSSHVIHCPAKKSKISLSSELDSFYSDIAMLNNDPPGEKASTDVITVQEPISSTSTQSTQSAQRPALSSGLSTSVTTIKHTENASSNAVAVKKKKKAKLTPGLSIKKKGVSSLVAKWQQVQQEVRRDLNSVDDEDENISSCNK